MSSRDQVIRVDVQSEEQIQLLQALETSQEWELDFWLHPVSTELPVDIRVPRSSLSSVKDYLQAHSIPFSVMIDNLQELLDEEKAEMEVNRMREHSTRSFNFGAYHTLDTIYSWMDTLVAEHPNLITKQEIGRSYENRPMYVLKFSTGGSNRPAIWIDTGIHSREWVSPATGVWTANKIATDYGTDASLTSLLNTMDIYLLILTNPDGYVYTHSNDRMWRKTRSRNSGSICRGVDPNRNWDAGFGGPGASSSPCSDSYRGPSAHSEIEVKNVVDLIKSHGNFKAFISVHAYSQLLMYPYGYTCTNVPHQAELTKPAVVASTGTLVAMVSSCHPIRSSPLPLRRGLIHLECKEPMTPSLLWTFVGSVFLCTAFQKPDTENLVLKTVYQW
uniref:Peptidase M14 domain-containing protein n=1 Tax=Amphiprion ocellaris TaxID=80972 RepID=A0A3Q1CK92_AMPOC